MAEYTYMQENGEYVIYEDGAVLKGISGDSPSDRSSCMGI